MHVLVMWRRWLAFVVRTASLCWSVGGVDMLVLEVPWVLEMAWVIRMVWVVRMARVARVIRMTKMRSMARMVGKVARVL